MILAFLSVLPHVVNINIAISLFFTLIIIARYFRWPDLKQPPPKILRLGLTLVSVVMVIVFSGFGDGRLFGVSLLIMMLSLKLLEAHNVRDFYVVAFLAFFVIVTQFLYSQNTLLMIAMLLLVMLLMGLLQRINSQQTMSFFRLFTPAIKRVIYAFPVMFILFFIFPRLSSPLWSLDFGSSATTGFSDSMDLSSVSQLSRSSKVAFRVSFKGDVPKAVDRYWRGIVLSETDGLKWTAAEQPSIRIFDMIVADQTIEYEMTMEASGERWLFPLDRLMALPNGMTTQNGSLQVSKNIHQRRTFHMRSGIGYLDVSDDPAYNNSYLAVPPTVTERMRQLASQWVRNANSVDEKVVASALVHFNTQPFVYTLNPGVLGDNPVDQFLFESQRGFCEHYASSFVLMMRLAGIPARVIGGYQGGEYNEVGNYLIVRQSDAHAWAEVWLEDTGWTRVDPTAAVAPERVERAIDFALSEDNERVRFSLASSGGLAATWLQAKWMMDNAELQWYRWVMGYNADKQMQILSSLGLDKWHKVQVATIAIVSVFVLGGMFLLLSVFLRRPKTDPVSASWLRFIEKLEKAGLAMPLSTPPLRVQQLAIDKFSDNQIIIQKIVQLYIAIEYRVQGNVEKQKKQFYTAVKQLKLTKEKVSGR